MAASSEQSDNAASSDTSAELGRLVAEMLLKSPVLAMNPTLVPHAAALAAATITGISLSAQMATVFLGALQGATEVANRFTAEKDGAAAATEAQGPNSPAHGEAAQQPNGTAPASETQPVNGAASIVAPEPVVSTAPKSKRVIKKTAKVDDLKRISGIGPKLEQMLNGLGIRSAAQIAAWTDDEVLQIDAALGIDGRIVRDNWVGQAKRLAA